MQCAATTHPDKHINDEVAGTARTDHVPQGADGGGDSGKPRSQACSIARRTKMYGILVCFIRGFATKKV